jgi:hypothetical protein
MTHERDGLPAGPLLTAAVDRAKHDVGTPAQPPWVTHVAAPFWYVICVVVQLCRDWIIPMRAAHVRPRPAVPGRTPAERRS